MQNSRFALSASITLYTKLLGLYPKRYRRRFGREMVQVFREVCREIYREGGFIGLMVLWLITAGDLIKTTLEERFNEVFHMKRDIFIPVGGWVLILWGLLLIEVAYGSPSGIRHVGNEDFYGLIEQAFWWGSGLFMAMGLAAFYLRFGKTLGWLGKLGLLQGLTLGLFSTLRVSWLPLIGGLLGLRNSSLERFDFLAMLLTMASGMIGLTLFGVDTIIRGSSPKWKLLPIVTGFAGFLLAIVAVIDPNNTTALTPLAGIMALGVVLNGLFLLMDQAHRRQKAPA